MKTINKSKKLNLLKQKNHKLTIRTVKLLKKKIQLSHKILEMKKKLTFKK